MGKRITIEEFINRAKAVYGDKYDYSLVEYKNKRTSLTIICPMHGKFSRSPKDYLNGIACSKCKKDISNNKKSEDFIKRAKKIHGDKYDYSNTKYTGINKRLMIFCKKHVEYFSQLASNHLSGSGCSRCSGTKKLTTEEFIKRSIVMHGNKYDYSKSNYINATTKINIICSIHGEFLQYPNWHITGGNCPKCASLKLNTEKFIQRAKLIHGDEYDYSKIDYKNALVKVEIICKDHGSFWQYPLKHTYHKQGCPQCKSSHGNRIINKFLLDHNITFIREAKFENCKYKRMLPFDFYLPDVGIKGTCIEYDGKQHHESGGFGCSDEKALFKIIQLRDAIKNKYCHEYGIRLIRIPYTEFDNISIILNKELDLDQNLLAFNT